MALPAAGDREQINTSLGALMDAAEDLPSPEEAVAPAATPEPTPTPTAAAEPTPAAAETPSAEPQAAAPTTPAERKAHEDFLAKHGGDPEKGAQHYFEVMSQNARFVKEREELVGRLAKLEEQVNKPSPTAAPPVSPAEPEAPASVKELESVILDLSQEFGQVEQSLAQIRDAHAKWAAHRDDLVERLATITDPDKLAETQSALAKARSMLSTLQSNGETAWRDRQRIIRDYRHTDILKRQALSLHAESQSRAKLESGSEERQIADFRRDYYSAVDRIAADKSIPEAQRAKFKRDAEVYGKAHIDQVGEFADQSAVDAFLSTLADDFVGTLRASATQYAQQKAADAKPAAPAGKAAVTPPAPGNGKSSAKTLDELQAQHDAAWANERI